MKNLLLLVAVVSGAYYLYTNAHEEAATQMVAAAAPAPVAPPQRQYFHSALDAPAMSTHESTGTGYYSADQNSRFNTYGGGYISSAQVAGGYPVYTGTTNNNAIINNYGGSTGSRTSSAFSGSGNVAGRVPTTSGRGTTNDNRRDQSPQRTTY